MVIRDLREYSYFQSKPCLMKARRILKEINPYLFAIAVKLFSDFEISKSENNTLLAKKIKVIKITRRLIFFMVSRFNRFGGTNF